jgi:hypothetical protein
MFATVLGTKPGAMPSRMPRWQSGLAPATDWLRQAMRRVTSDDVPTSWQAGGAGGRSHESGPYQRRWMLRRDDETSHP